MDTRTEPPYSQSYLLAIVLCPDSWKPKNICDLPAKYTVSKLLARTTLKAADRLSRQHNRECLASGSNNDWTAVFPPGISVVTPEMISQLEKSP